MLVLGPQHDVSFSPLPFAVSPSGLHSSLDSAADSSGPEAMAKKERTAHLAAEGGSWGSRPPTAWV